MRLAASALACAESTDWRREIGIIESVLSGQAIAADREALHA
jgi:hypothetical protein